MHHREKYLKKIKSKSGGSVMLQVAALLGEDSLRQNCQLLRETGKEQTCLGADCPFFTSRGRRC